MSAGRPSSARELRLGGAPEAVASRLEALLRGELPAGATILKAGAVYRVGEHVVKLFPRSTSVLARLRTPRALRAVKTYERLLPVLSPRPVHWDRLSHPSYESLLVYEYCEGPTLLELWHEGAPEPRAALPRFFADLHATGVLLGDLHAKNLIWTDRGWCVIDLDGVRTGLQALRRRQLVERTWARLLFDFDCAPEAEELYARFLALAGEPWDARASWKRILERYQDVLRVRLAAGVRPGD